LTKISKNFFRHEFECNCGCGFDVVDVELVGLLERIRGHFKSPLTISSGARCLSWNQSVGGSLNSQHLLGKAADISVKGVSEQEVADFAEETMPDRGGIGRYVNFIHVDVRDRRSIWGNT